MLSDYQFRILGAADNAKNAASDAGANNNYPFRTPRLRNGVFTTPGLYSDTLPNLQAMLNFYDPGRKRPAGGRQHLVRFITHFLIALFIFQPFFHYFHAYFFHYLTGQRGLAAVLHELVFRFARKRT